MMTNRYWLCLLIMLLLVGCGATNDISSSNEDAVSEPTVTKIIENSSADVEEAAITFLADSLEVPTSDVAVVRFAPREWTDGSLNCDEQSDEETSILGYHLLAKVGEMQYDVRTNNDGSTIVRCEPAASNYSDDASPETEQAVTLLAEQLGDLPDSFSLVEKREVTWSDGSLGCPQPDEMYTMALTDGYQFIFERNNELYYIHSDKSLSQMIICDDPEEPLN